MTAQEIANQIRESNEWPIGACLELCCLAGLEQEFNSADGDSFESVVYKAADKLGVEVLWRYSG